DLEALRTPERPGGQVVRGVLDLHDGEVGGRIRPDHLGLVQPAINHHDLQFLRAGDDVVVREDPPVVVDDHARTRPGTVRAGDLDRDDGGAHLTRDVRPVRGAGTRG